MADGLDPTGAVGSRSHVPTKGAPQNSQRGPYTGERQVWVEEKAKLVKQITMLKAQNAQEALPLVQRMLAKDREVFGTNHEETADTLAVAAGVYFAASQFDLAVSSMNEIWQIRKALYGEQDWRALDARWQHTQYKHFVSIPESLRQVDGQASDTKSKAQQQLEAGAYQQALATAKQTLAQYQQVYGDDAPACAVALELLAKISERTRDLDETEKYLQSASAIYRGWYTAQSPGFARVLNGLGWVRYFRNQNAEAEQLLRKSLEIYESIGDAPMGEYSHTLSRLARVLEGNGQPARAVEVQRRAIQVAEQTGTSGPFSYVDDRLLLADLLSLAGQYKEAGEVLDEAEQAISQDETIRSRLGPKALQFRAEWHQRQERYPEALDLLQKAYELRRQRSGEASAECGVLLHSIAANHESQGKSAEAERNYEQSVAVLLKAEGPQSGSARNTCNALIGLQTRMAGELTVAGKLAEAQAKLEACVRRAVEVFGAENGATQSARDRLEYQTRLAAAAPEVRTALVEAEKLRAEGVALFDKQQFAEALDLYRRAWDLSRPHLASDDLRAGTLLRQASNAAWRLRQFDQAETWRRLSEPAFAKFVGTGTKAEAEYARTLCDIGNLCYEQSKMADAADYLSRAVEVYRGAKTANAFEIVGTIKMLVNAYAALGDEPRCLPALAEYVERVRQVYGESRVEFVEALRTQGQVAVDLGKYDLARSAYAQALERASELELGEGWDRALQFAIAQLDAREGKLEAAVTAMNDLLTYYRQVDSGSNLLGVLNQVQSLARKQRRWDDAETTLIEAIELAKKLHGDDSSTVGELQNDLERVLLTHIGEAKDQLRFADAVPIYERLVAQRVQRFGEDHWATRDPRAYLADTRRLTQLTAAQTDQLRQSLADFAAADAHSEKGHHQEALVAAQRGAERLKTTCGERSLRYRDALAKAISLHERLGQFDQAEALLRKQIALYSELAAPQSLEIAERLTDLAKNLKLQKRPADAVAAARDAAEMYRALGYPSVAARGAILTSEGVLLTGMGQLAAAKRAFDEAESILASQRADNVSLWLDYLDGRYHLGRAIGDGQQALQSALASLEFNRLKYGEDNGAYAAALLKVGVAHSLSGNHAEAIEVMQRALALWAKRRSTQTFEYAVIEDRLGAAQLELGQLADALAHTERALDIFQAVHRPGNAQAAQIRLAQIFLNQGQLQRAEPILRKLVALTGDDARVQARRHNASSLLSCLLLVRGADAEALPLVERAMASSESALAVRTDYSAERVEVQWRKNSRVILDRYAVLAARQAVAPEVVYNRVLGWKGSLYARQRRLRALRSSSEAAPLLNRWGSLSGALATLSLRTPYPEERAVWNARLATLQADKDELEQKLWALVKIQPAPATVDANALQAVLPADAALVDFLEIQRETLQVERGIVNSRGLLAFVIRKNAPVALVDLGDAEFVVQLIDRWRQTTLGDGDNKPDPEAALQVANQLKIRLWAPLEQHLDGVKTVLIAPEGALGKLPFAALPGREPNSFLIDERAFATVAAPGLIPELTARRRSPAELSNDASLLLVGDIDYGAAPGQLGEQVASTTGDSRSWLPYSFRELPGFGPEIADIRTAFTKRHATGKVQLLERQAATEQAFRTAAAKHRWLHIATHGFFAPDVLTTAAQAVPQAAVFSGGEEAPPPASAVSSEGLTSGLALAGANKINEEGQDDGILSAMEVGTLDLSGVEMAVLSACETGLGESVGGESVVGLQRAFQVAGARTTVTSLWPVSDAATRLLMARFYRNLWNKDQPMSRLEALTEAQRWMLRAARAGAPSKGKEAVLSPDDKTLPFAFQWPTFWAAFVMCGDWR